MNRSICEAVRVKAVVRFSYGGVLRSVEPHCHGISSAGSEVLRGYQTGGYSGAGNPVGWRLFEVAKISGFGQSGQMFSSARPAYNPYDRGMVSVHCHV